jgi:dihydropteroate synthase
MLEKASAVHDAGAEMKEKSAGRIVLPWKLRARTIELGQRTRVCGVVNVTPDSFSDGGRFLDPEVAVAHAQRLLDEGADLLDVGAESTRPGSSAGGVAALSTDEEQARLLPVLEGILKARPEAIISVDTYKAATAKAALAAGAEIINDVSGLTWDEGMADVCARERCGVILMHSRGRPEEWKAHTALAADELTALVESGLRASLDKAVSTGVASESVVLDPGYGFGKRGDENFALLARQAELLKIGRPLLAGLSRKSFLGRALAPVYAGQPAPMEARETAGIAAVVAAILNGASLVRVHQVRPAVEAALIADAVLSQMNVE